jgi:hypothetical protein
VLREDLVEASLEVGVRHVEGDPQGQLHLARDLRGIGERIAVVDKASAEG